jgi:hypothetical protein
MNYIQRKDQYNLETVDHAESMKEARRLLAEYRLSDPYAHYYLSSRCCINYWSE